MKKNHLLILVLMLTFVHAKAQDYYKVADKTEKHSKADYESSTVQQVRSTAFQHDDFESYTDFSLSFSPWTLEDIDSTETWGIEGVDFPNQYAPMAFIVFNPLATIPPMTNPGIQPYSGSKIAACFASSVPPNNDWLISPAILADSITSVSFQVKSYTAQYGLERYKVGVSTTNTSPESFTIISGTNYLTAPATAWELKTFNLNAYSGQTIYVGIQCISNAAFIFMVDDFNISNASTQNSSLTGMVTNAIDGNPVAGALVSIAGLSDTTDSLGNYSIRDIPEGALVANFNASQTSGTAPLSVVFADQSTENSSTITCSKAGYLTYTNNQVVIPEGESLTMNISLSPTLAVGNMRFVLNWGASPSDLDSHLNTPSILGQNYHIYFDNEGNATQAPFALLDFDITTGFGPETMTIYQMFDGTYQYYVHNYSENPDIKTSQAVVQIYNQSGLQHTIQIPGTGAGLYWYVCDVDGASGLITLRNVIQATPPGSFRNKSPLKYLKPPVSGDRNITTWQWNFGDGETSADQNPTHTFTTNGNYTISLTVSNGSAQVSETKEAYIQVGTQSIGENKQAQQILLYPVPAKGEMQVESKEKIDFLHVTDLTGIEIFRCRVDNFNYKLNVENLSSGMYFLLIDTQKGSTVEKFTVE